MESIIANNDGGLGTRLSLYGCNVGRFLRLDHYQPNIRHVVAAFLARTSLQFEPTKSRCIIMQSRQIHSIQYVLGTWYKSETFKTGYLLTWDIHVLLPTSLHVLHVNINKAQNCLTAMFTADKHTLKGKHFDIQYFFVHMDNTSNHRTLKCYKKPNFW